MPAEEQSPPQAHSTVVLKLPALPTLGEANYALMTWKYSHVTLGNLKRCRLCSNTVDCSLRCSGWPDP